MQRSELNIQQNKRYVTRIILASVSVISWLCFNHFFFFTNVISRKLSSFQHHNPGSITIRDERPISPKGFICIDGDKGRLNNIIIQVLIGLNMASYLNRTLLVHDGFSAFYDINRLGLATYPPISTATSPDPTKPSEFKFPYRPLLTVEEVRSFHYRGKNITFSGHSCPQSFLVNVDASMKELTIPGRFRSIEDQTFNWPVVTISNNDIWYWLGRPPEQFYARYFGGLVPKIELNNIANAFVENELFTNYLGNPSREYTAVHLRFLEGHCKGLADDASLCCPSLHKVLSIMKSRNVSLSIPMFVASDGQCGDNIVEDYRSFGAVMGITHIPGKYPCEGTECAVLDFEVCSRSSFFVGLLGSTAAMNIRESRTARGHAGNTSVLSLRESTMKKENWTAITRYYLGHNGWGSNCEDLDPWKRRNRPCL